MNGTDMIITAAYGAISYWARVTDYCDEAGKGKITVQDMEQGGTYTVTAGDMTKAARKVLELYPKTAGAGYIREDDIDAEAADMIFQVACFGEIVYG
jgi:hypothetical protein